MSKQNLWREKVTELYAKKLGSYGVKKIEMEDRAFLCIAMNASSPTGRFKDSTGYEMLLRKTYAAQKAAAEKMDAHLSNKK